MHLRHWAVSPFIAAAFGCSGSSPATGALLVGCYQLSLESWQPTPAPDDAAFMALPNFFRLTPDLGEAPFYPEGSRRITPAIVSAHHDALQERAYWRHLSGDSLELIWSDGFTTVSLTVQSRDSVLQGIARAFSDVQFSSPIAQAAARAVRAPCDEVPAA